MSILDDLPDVIAEALDDVFRDGVLEVPPSGPPVSDGQGGWIYGDPVEHGCKALVADASDFRRIALGFPAEDRLVLVLSATVEGGAVPKKGDKIFAADPLHGFALREFDVIKRHTDPAAAVCELQAR